MAKLQCGECSSKIKNGWKFCSSCGESIQWVALSDEAPHKTGFITYCGYAAVVALLIAPVIGIYNERDADLLQRLKSQGVIAWTEDTTSEAVMSAGQFAPEEMITTATGSCSIWLYANEDEATQALDNYINDNIEFSAAWSGVEERSHRGAILLTSENNSFCSEEAAHYLEWTLE